MLEITPRARAVYIIIFMQVECKNNTIVYGYCKHHPVTSILSLGTKILLGDTLRAVLVRMHNYYSSIMNHVKVRIEENKL